MRICTGTRAHVCGRGGRIQWAGRVRGLPTTAVLKIDVREFGPRSLVSRLQQQQVSRLQQQQACVYRVN